MKFSDYEEKSQDNDQDGDFYNIEEGQNKVRILSEATQFGQHYSKEEGYVVCIGKDEGCEYCGKGKDPSARYLFWLYDREKDVVQVLNAPYSVFKGIGKLASSDDWGYEGTPPYDIIISKKGEGLDTEYGIMPTKENDKLDEEIINRYKDVRTPTEDILERMKDKVRENTDGAKKTSENGDEDITEEVDVDDIPL